MSSNKADCDKLRVSFSSILGLQKRFEEEFELARNTKDFKKIRKLEKELETKINSTFESMDIYPVMVDYSLSLEEMIQRCKFEGGVGENFTKNFTIKKLKSGERKVTVGVKIVNFDKEVTIQDVLKSFEEHNLRPATIEEMLAFEASYYKKPEGIMVCLGSSYKDTSNYIWFPKCYDVLPGMRALSFSRLGVSTWSNIYFLLAVRKSS